MLKVSIAGATGYTGLELIRLLLRHPAVTIAQVTADAHRGKSLAEVCPSLAGLIDRELVALGPEVAAACDVLFLALPHGAGMARMPEFLGQGCRVIDLSADFRLRDSGTFEAWYHQPHASPACLEQAVYGLPELHRKAIAGARLVANPGCYPTSVILAAAPLIQTGWIDLDSLIADSKSGVSGAGRKANAATRFCETHEGVKAYGLTTHRHTPEIEQELGGLAGRELRLSFSPHLIPMTRGILTTLYARLTREVPLEDLHARYREFYAQEPFVRILPPGSFADTHQVARSNFCDIGLAVDTRTRRVIVTSALDNLIKGASGQAVQNLNLMLGLDETTGLEQAPVFP